MDTESLFVIKYKNTLDEYSLREAYNEYFDPTYTEGFVLELLNMDKEKYHKLIKKLLIDDIDNVDNIEDYDIKIKQFLLDENIIIKSNVKSNLIPTNKNKIYSTNWKKISIDKKEFSKLDNLCNGHYYIRYHCSSLCFDCDTSACSCNGFYHCCCLKIKK